MGVMFAEEGYFRGIYLCLFNVVSLCRDQVKHGVVCTVACVVRPVYRTVTVYSCD